MLQDYALRNCSRLPSDRRLRRRSSTDGDRCAQYWEADMRLEEIRPSAAELRVKQLKTNAKPAKERARQLKAQADINGERLEMQKSRAALTQAQRSAAVSMIKPCG